jgi:hypothetical protein
MGAEALAEANLRIESDRPDDLLDSDRLGLFVVSRLARRHGIKVALRQSAYGGTTAVVLLPKALLVESELPTGSRPAAIGTRQDSDDGRDATLSRRSATATAQRTGALVGSGPATTKAPHAGSAPAVTPPSTPPQASDPAPPIGTLPRRLPSQPEPVHPDSRPAAPSGPDIGAGAAIQVEPAVLRASTGPETSGGLPRRVKQASLAPGLRMDPAAAGGPPDVDEDPAPRTPEQARATMAAYQKGWSRGRSGPGPATAAAPLIED